MQEYYTHPKPSDIAIKKINGVTDFLTEICVVCVHRCREAAAPPVRLCEAEVREAPGPAETEMVPSSQGSPVFSPPVSMKVLPHIEGCDRLRVLDEANASVVSTPASSQVTGELPVGLIGLLWEINILKTEVHLH